MKAVGFFIFFIFVGTFQTALGQDQKPEFLGHWIPGDDDFGEFIFHKLERFKFVYLEHNPEGKILIVLCSKHELPLALASSAGFGYSVPERAQNYFEITQTKIYFAVDGGCPVRSEYYWLIPKDLPHKYWKAVSGDKITIKRWIEDYSETPFSIAEKAEFAQRIESAIAVLKGDPKTSLFVINNLRTSRQKTVQALSQFKRGGVGGQVTTVTKREYRTFYPEFITVAVKK
jgi:hypothetical protein